MHASVDPAPDDPTRVAGSRHNERHLPMFRKILAPVLVAVALVAALVSPAAAAGGNGAPKHLAAPTFDAGRTWTAPLASAPRAAGPSSALTVSTFCSTSSNLYRAQLEVQWWASGSVAGSDLVIVRYQKRANTSSPWANFDWATSHNIDFRRGSTIVDRYGPENPPATRSFYHWPQGQTAPISSANERLRASGSGFSVDCTQYNPY